MIDTTAADYCMRCGQPREVPDKVLWLGLCLNGPTLSYRGKIVRVRPGWASFLHTVMERGFASTELLRLRFCIEADSKLIHVYACHVRKILDSLTGGEVQLRTVHSWGYELVGFRQRAAA